MRRKMRRKPPAKGTSQLREHLFPPARVNTVATWVENKKVQLVDIAHNVDPIMLVVFLLAVSQNGGPLLHDQGEGQAGAAGLQEYMHHCCLHTG